MAQVQIIAERPPVLTPAAAAVLARLIRERIEAKDRTHEQERRITDAA